MLPPFELGEPGPMRDTLVSAVLDGVKTATTSMLAQYDPDDEPLPAAGERFAMIDSAHLPIAIVETTDVSVIRLGDADLRLAIDEGEGFASVSEWRAAHERYWNTWVIPELADPAANALTDDTMIVVERFRLVELITE